MKTVKLHIWHISLCTLLAAFLFSCKKQDQFLNALPNENLAVPNTLSDLQLMIQNDQLFNAQDPGWGQESSDDGFTTTNFFLRNTPLDQNIFIWEKNIYPDQVTGSPDWSLSYQQVFYANTILEALEKINPTSSQTLQFNTIKGSALFFRAKAFYNLLQEFAKPFNSNTANTDMGIPLRVSSDFNKKYPRASVKACYDQVIGDMQAALNLLPNTSTLITLPNKISANGFLARIYLTMSDYKNAFSYSNASLSSYNTLTDYNSLNIGDFPITNSPLAEDVFHCVTLNYFLSNVNHVMVDSSLYNSYDNNDLRKSIFFFQNLSFYSFWGTYDVLQTNFSFDGIATDEMYLIRAESNARLGNVSDAMNDLNALLVKRYITNTFVPRVAANSSDALTQILTERRKELVWRGLRWSDLRRLNQEPQFAITLKRYVNGITYTLPPNDPRYTLPIPPQEIILTGIQQNPR